MKKSFQQARRRAAEGITYKHDLGQHFLYDEVLLRSLVEATGVGPADGVLEIGPGAGTLTRCLCEAAGRVVAWRWTVMCCPSCARPPALSTT